jgi:CHAT domain-containing protein
VNGNKDAEGIRIAGSRISASFGMGGGTIILDSTSGIALTSTALVASGDRVPLINGSAFGTLVGEEEETQWRPYGFKAGMISLINRSTTTPISLANTKLLSLQASSGGGLASSLLTIASQAESGYYGKDLSNPAFTLGLSSDFNGGMIQILSRGGIAISNGSLIDASSRAEGGQQLENIAGSMVLINRGGPLQIQDSALLARSGPALDATNKDHVAGLIQVFNVEGAITLSSSQLDARADASRSTELTTPSSIRMQAGVNDNVTIAGSRIDATTLQQIDEGPQEWNVVNIVDRDRGNRTREPILDEAATTIERLSTLFQQQAVAQLGPTSPFNSAALAVAMTATDTAAPLVAENVIFQPPQAAVSLERAAETPVAITISLNQEAPGAALSEWQQRTLAATAQQLGLSPSVGKLRSIAELQQRLGEASQRSPLAPYSPAILNLQREDQPTGTTRLTAILLTANGEPLSRSLELPRARLDGWIRSFQRQLSRRAASPANPERDPARLLAQALLEPLAPALRERGVTALLVEADRGLQAIPFAALPLDGRPLGEALALTITPALGLIDLDPARLGQPSGKVQMLLAGATSFRQGLEPLPMVRQELQALAAEHPATLLLDGAFTPSALLEQARAPGVRQLHIATHANFLPGQASNGLLYTPTTALSLAELGRGLRARASTSPLDQITLSSCLTALGDERSELGFVGMALQAGARSGLGTLWEVDDAATAAFFIQYYRYLKQGLPKDQALQATQRAFLRQEVRLEGDRLVGPDPAAARRATLVGGLEREHQSFFAQGLDHPYFWAGMVLSGSPW